MLDLSPFFMLDALSPQRWLSRKLCPNFRGGLYGGQLLAHALAAVANEQPERPVHTLHSQFLAAGNVQSPIEYRIKCLRRGRSFIHYQIHARQNRRLIALMIAACHSDEQGFSHQERAPELQPPTESCPPCPPVFEIDNWLLGAHNETPLEFVFAEGARLDQSSPGQGPSLCWLRIRAPLQTHQQLPALAFISDLGILASTLTPHPSHLFHRALTPASLNHTLWLHSSSLDLNQWHLLKITSPWAGSGRGLGLSYLFDTQGLLVASAAQEGLIRPELPAKHR
jgi:acyl-CoA thioesterase II